MRGQRRIQWPSTEPNGSLIWTVEPFKCYILKMELTVVIPLNTKRRRNFVLMFLQRRRYSNKPIKKLEYRSLKFEFKITAEKNIIKIPINLS